MSGGATYNFLFSPGVSLLSSTVNCGFHMCSIVLTVRSGFVCADGVWLDTNISDTRPSCKRNPTLAAGFWMQIKKQIFFSSLLTVGYNSGCLGNLDGPSGAKSGLENIDGPSAAKFASATEYGAALAIGVGPCAALAIGVGAFIEFVAGGALAGRFFWSPIVFN